ncbi:MAG: hypothetical protein KBA31_19450 [Alphaproteobacteria bacterium]|nr:hypothetical protein [Alphaproteobacteria bacterium]
MRRDQADPMDASPPMRSGDFDVYLPGDFDVDGRLAIVQSEPLPLDVLSIMPVMSVMDG